jgi:SAM-dependent methyltransferase
MVKSVEQHNAEIHANREHWRRKPVLRAIYRHFYELIAAQLRRDVPGRTVELGSGIGNLKSVVPDCLCTDLFANPWIDQVEDAYALSFADGAVANLVLFDVFHHLEFPGSALQEFQRVLAPGGRVVIFDPAISALGWVVYGLCHHEPVGWRRPIIWRRPADSATRPAGYYAAQGNATRVFVRGEFADGLRDWRLRSVRRWAVISYVASGGYRGPQLYPAALLPLMRWVDRVCDFCPPLFATRLLAVLEKR